VVAVASPATNLPNKYSQLGFHSGCLERSSTPANNPLDFGLNHPLDLGLANSRPPTLAMPGEVLREPPLLNVGDCFFMFCVSLQTAEKTAAVVSRDSNAASGSAVLFDSPSEARGSSAAGVLWSASSSAKRRGVSRFPLLHRY
jgi:hypothetical protein